MASNRQQALGAGTLIDGFEIRKVIGTGGFGVTYEAFDTSLERSVAIKEYCPQGIASRTPGDTTLRASDPLNEDTFNYGLTRFLDEARTLAKFQHSSIVHVHRFLEANGTGYLIMDFEQGQTLWGVLRRHAPLDESAVLALLIPLLEGLQVVHEQSFLHRDIKPANVLMRDNGAPVLLDFGAARLAMEQQASALTVMLTPGYAPLEQYSATDQQGAWTDLYALGGTAYHCMTGQAPMAATERIARLHSGQPDEVNTRLQDATGRYSTQLLETVQWMMEPIAGRRPKSADQVLRELREIATAGNTGKQTVPHSTNPSPAHFEASPALTHALQNTLEKHAGRIARKVVPRAVSTAANYNELVDHLAGYVLDPESEIEFRALATGLPARTSEAATVVLANSQAAAPGTATSDQETEVAAATKLPDDVLARARTHLANFVGPIAEVLIEAAAAQTTDASRFHALLADEIDDPADRSEFLSALATRRS